MEHYPLPKVEDLFSKLSGNTLFTKLDMSQTYLQLLVDDQSKELLTVNIPTKACNNAYNRLPFGVSLAPGIFQCTMESHLKGIPNVLVYLDNILITGPTQEKHMKNLLAVLSSFHQVG